MVKRQKLSLHFMTTGQTPSADEDNAIWSKAPGKNLQLSLFCQPLFPDQRSNFHIGQKHWNNLVSRQDMTLFYISLSHAHTSPNMLDSCLPHRDPPKWDFYLLADSLRSKTRHCDAARSHLTRDSTDNMKHQSLIISPHRCEPWGEQHKRLFSDVVHESAAQIIKKSSERRKWRKLLNGYLWGKQTDTQRLSALCFFLHICFHVSPDWKKRVHRSSEDNNNQDIIIPGLALRPWLWEMEERRMRVSERVVKEEEF